MRKGIFFGQVKKLTSRLPVKFTLELIMQGNILEPPSTPVINLDRGQGHKTVNVINSKKYLVKNYDSVFFPFSGSLDKIVLIIQATSGLHEPILNGTENSGVDGTYKGSFILKRKRTRKRIFSLMFAATAVAGV